MTRILVTGAGGFVGRALLPRLAEAGHAVVAAVRVPSPVPWLAAAEQRVVGDIGPQTDWSAALAGIEAVVHLAARVHQMHESDSTAVAEHRRVNTAGTRCLAEAAVRAGVRRFLFMSTIKVNGERTLHQPFREDDPPAPADPYAVSKWEAERALREIAAASSMELVVLRPPLVYGPGVKGNFLGLLRACRRGLPLPLGSIVNRRSLVAAANLADAVRLCLEHPQAGGQLFLVRDGDDVSTPELVRRVSRALGRSARLPPVPVALLRGAARMAGKGAAVGRLLDSLAVDDGKLRTALGWTPPQTMDEALAATAAWFARETAILGRPTR